MGKHGPIYQIVEKRLESNKRYSEEKDYQFRKEAKGAFMELETILPKIQELEPVWISVSERLPEIEEHVLVFSNGTTRIGAIDEFYSDRFYDIATNNWFADEPTYGLNYSKDVLAKNCSSTLCSSEIIGHEPTIADFHKWLTVNGFQWEHYMEQIAIYLKDSDTDYYPFIDYNPSKSLLDQSASSQEKIIEFINNNNDKCEIL